MLFECLNLGIILKLTTQITIKVVAYKENLPIDRKMHSKTLGYTNL